MRTIKAKAHSSIVRREACRVCGNRPLSHVMDLGSIYVSNFIDSERGFRAPMELVLCPTLKGGCGLIQLRHTVSTDLLYRRYWYKSGVNMTMRRALAEITSQARRRTALKTDDIVLDIGCNDGTLLRTYPSSLRRVGFEPARNLVSFAREGTTRVINSFFNSEEFAAYSRGEKAKAITAIAMFYDLDDPNTFVADLVKCLHREGVIIIQQNYLPAMLKMNAFDNIVHEHLEYYSLTTLERLLGPHGLVVEDVELNDVNGGSFRVYLRHREYPRLKVTNRVGELRREEARMGLDSIKPYEHFAARVASNRKRLRSLVKRETSRGKVIYVYGASTRGNTLLQYCGLDHRLIKAAIERNPDKWGRRTVGTRIPIISEEQARKDRPDYFLILPWQFLPEFRKREGAYLRSGGKFILPIPRTTIVRASR